jgi:polyferredoxin
LDESKKKSRRKIKYIVFVLWIIFIILGPLLAGGYQSIQIYYPNPPENQTLISFDGTVPIQLIFYFGIQIFIAVLFTLISGNRSFCNYGCPMGVLGILGTKIKNILKYPSLHLSVSENKCVKCKKCSKSCPMSLNVQEMVALGNMINNDCILCGSCIDVCEKEVIKYAWIWK